MRQYIPQLDGLRFCAFLGVFVSHALDLRLPSGPASWPEWWGSAAVLSGGFGVALFFVLSSYLITSLLLWERAATGHIDVVAFWMRRVLRIWPLYFGFLIGLWSVGGLSGDAFIAFAVFAGNWGVALWDVSPGLAGPLWSVSIEEQFYLSWPLFLAMVPPRFLRPTGCLLILVAVVARYWFFLNGASVPDVWLNTLSHLDAIGIGVLIALMPTLHLKPVTRGALGLASTVVIITCAGAVWFQLMVVPTLHVQHGGAGVATLVFLGVSAACGGLLLASLAGSAWLSHPSLTYLGRISYGLYVFHTTAIAIVLDWWWPSKLLVAFVLAVAFASISYRFFELPFLRRKVRYAYVHSRVPW